MKKVEVIAYHGQGPKRVFAGKTVIEVPTTFKEAEKMEGWGEKGTLEMAEASKVIAVQRTLRGPKAMSEAERIFKSLPKEEQDRLMGLKKAKAPKKATVKRRRAGTTTEVTAGGTASAPDAQV